MTVCEPEFQLREREIEAKLKTLHHPHWPSSSPLWRKRLPRKSLNTYLLFTPVTSDWLCTHKSSNPTTIEHRKFRINTFLQTQLFGLFYSFVSNTIVKTFTCLHVLCFWKCIFFCTFFVTICWYNSMNPTILLSAMGNKVGQTGPFNPGMTTSLGEGKLWIQTCKTVWKLTLCSI